MYRRIPAIQTSFDPSQINAPASRVFVCIFSNCEIGFSTVAACMLHIKEHQCGRCGVELDAPELSLHIQTYAAHPPQHGAAIVYSVNRIPPNLNHALFGPLVVANQGGISVLTYNSSSTDFENIGLFDSTFRLEMPERTAPYFWHATNLQ